MYHISMKIGLVHGVKMKTKGVMWVQSPHVRYFNALLEKVTVLPHNLAHDLSLENDLLRQSKIDTIYTVWPLRLEMHPDELIQLQSSLS